MKDTRDPTRLRSQRSPAARVLDETARARRLTVRLPDDLSWLDQISPAPRKLLSEMSRRGQLHLVGDNRYVVAPIGTETLEQAAPAELLVDLLLRPRGQYYLGFLTALIAHRLTDLHSETTYAAVPQGTRLRIAQPLPLKIVPLSPSLWPADDGDEIERIRVVPGAKEFAYRSSIERALIDGLIRPELCAGFETVVLSWSRARRRPDISWDRVAQIGRRLGKATARRTRFMLELLDLDPVVDRHLADLDIRKASTPLDRSNGFGLGRTEMQRDPRSGVLLNIPREYLRGWIEGEVLG